MHTEARERPDFATLRADIETDWAPDPWNWEGYPFSPSTASPLDLAIEERVESFVVPFVGGRERLVPLLGPFARLSLESLGRTVASNVDSDLAAGVFGYRARGTQRIANYRDEYRLRMQYEAQLRQGHGFVATADIRSFFPSADLALLQKSFAPYLSESAASDLVAILTRVEQAVGHPLPEGYPSARALANTTLMGVDDSIAVPFTRWIDDYRLFAHSRAEAEEALQAVVAKIALATPYTVAREKLAVMPSKAVETNSPGSLADSHPEVEDVSQAVALLLAAEDATEASFERRLRHYLRLAAERQDPGILSALHSMGEQLPAAAAPRLAWYLAEMAGHPLVSEILKDQLEIEDQYGLWRTLRLAPVYWYLDELPSNTPIDRLVARCGRSHSVARALIRPLAKHRPDLIAIVIPTEGEAGHADLHRRLASDEHRVQNGPPVVSFL